MITHKKTFMCNANIKLPFELNLSGYQYCGPGTKLSKRLARGNSGINLLDFACKQHDIAYFRTNIQTERNKADFELADKAWQKVKAKDSSFGEQINAFLVTNAINSKTKFRREFKVRSKTRRNNIKKICFLLSKILTNLRAAIKCKKTKNLLICN